MHQVAQQLPLYPAVNVSSPQELAGKAESDAEGQAGYSNERTRLVRVSGAPRSLRQRRSLQRRASFYTEC